MLHGRVIACMLLAALGVAAAPALADDSLLDSIGKATGLIAPPNDPSDFVKASRPSETPAEIPVFAKPEEPPSKIKTPTELKAMDADLEGAAGRAKPGKAQSPRKANRKPEP